MKQSIVAYITGKNIKLLILTKYKNWLFNYDFVKEEKIKEENSSFYKEAMKELDEYLGESGGEIK